MAKAEIEVTFTLPIDESFNTKLMRNVRRKKLLCLNFFGTGILVRVEPQNSLIFPDGISQT